jgi:hypothetical protein
VVQRYLECPGERLLVGIVEMGLDRRVLGT